MKLSIRENMVPGATLLEKFQNLDRIGYHGIEITHSSTLAHAEEIRAFEARRKAEQPWLF